MYQMIYSRTICAIQLLCVIIPKLKASQTKGKLEVSGLFLRKKVDPNITQIGLREIIWTKCSKCSKYGQKTAFYVCIKLRSFDRVAGMVRRRYATRIYCWFKRDTGNVWRL